MYGFGGLEPVEVGMLPWRDNQPNKQGKIGLGKKLWEDSCDKNLIFYSLNWIESWASDFVNAIRWKYDSERNLSTFSFFWRQMIIRMVFEFEVCVSYFQLFCICGRNNLIVFEAEYRVLFSTKLWYLCFCIFVFLWFCIFEMNDLMAFEAEFRVPPLANHFQT